MKNNASLVYGLFLIAGDFLALVAAFVTAYILRVKVDARPVINGVGAQEYLETFLSLLPFWLIIFGLLALYNKNTYENRFSEFGRLLIGSFVGILFVISYGYITQTQIFPTRLVTVYGFLLAFFFVLLFRTIARSIRRSLFHYGIGVNNVLIVGESPITERFIDSIERTNVTGYRIVGIVAKKNIHNKYQHFSSFSLATQALEEKGIHSIIQTELFAEPPRNNEILVYAQENHVAYRFVPGNSELFVGNIDVDLFYSIPVIAVHQTALVGWGRIVKRLFDIAIGGLMLILALPIMAFVGLLIIILDRGDVFFRQTRLSRFNSKVEIFKFRTIKKKYNGLLPEEAFEKMGKPHLAKEYRDNGDFLQNDPRISSIGKFLRRTSLDELPQLINVVKGDISLVGPRALVERDLSTYNKKNLILSVKSGMTGLAVISGRKDLPIEERRKLDLFYVQNWSFWNDIVILAKTIAVVLFHRGAK